MAFLEERRNAGCHNARVLYDELKERQYRGGYVTVSRFVAQWRE